MKMKRNKEIVLAAKAAEKSTGFGELVHSKESRGVNSAYGIGFLEGAVWSDEHPIHYDGQAMLHVLQKGKEFGKEEMLDRVCKWLEEHSWDYLVGADNVYILLDDKMVSDLKKAMEG